MSISKMAKVVAVIIVSSVIVGCSHSREDKTHRSNGNRSDQYNSNEPRTGRISFEPAKQANEETKIPADLSNVKGLIVKGDRIATIELGAKRETIIEELGQPTEEYYNSLCKVNEIHWNDEELGNNGIFVYFRDERVFQITSQTERFKLQNNITVGYSPRFVEKMFPNLEAFELMKSANRMNGYANVIFWVDSKSGIAFGLYNFGRLNSRRIGSITIFEPSAEFQPNGTCAKGLSPQMLLPRTKWFVG